MTSPRPDQEIDPPAQVIAPGGAAGVFRGRLVIIFGSTNGIGLFVYSPSPGSGNLKESITSASILDPYGNSTGEGFSSYSGNSGTDFFMSLTDAGLQWGLNSDLPGGTGALAIVGGAELRIQNLLVATDPNAAATPESWHSLGTLANFTVTRGRYRLTPEGETELDVHVVGNGSNASSTTFSTALPVAYRPTGATRRFPLESGRNVTNGDPWPRVEVDTSGNVTVIIAANVSNAFSNVMFMPLDA